MIYVRTMIATALSIKSILNCLEVYWRNNEVVRGTQPSTKRRGKERSGF